MASTRGMRGARGQGSGPEGAGRWTVGGWFAKRDIPSPVLTGQVQRVWISAGSMRGTPCQCPSLAVPSACNEVAGTARTGRNATPAGPHPRPCSVCPVLGPFLELRRRDADAEDDRFVGGRFGRRRRSRPGPWPRGPNRLRPSGDCLGAAPRRSRSLRPGRGWRSGCGARGGHGRYLPRIRPRSVNPALGRHVPVRFHRCAPERPSPPGLPVHVYPVRVLPDHVLPVRV